MSEDKPEGTAGGSGGQRIDADLAERMRKAKEAQARVSAEKARSRAPKASLIRYAAVVVLTVLTLGMVVYFTGTGSSHEKAVANNLSQIKDLEKALAEADVDIKNVPNAEQLSPAFAEAAAKAEELVTLQNDMAALNFDIKDRDPELAKYSDLVDEAKKYFTTGSLSGGQFLPHGQWYQPHKPGKNIRGQAAWVRIPASEWTWTAYPTKSVDADGNISVVWKAAFVGGKNDGLLLAWVTGKFDSRRGEFFDLKRGLTPEGAKRLGATTSPPEGSGDENTQLIPAPNDKDLIDEAIRSSKSKPNPSSIDDKPENKPAEPTEDKPEEKPADEPEDGSKDEGDTADPGLDGGN